MKCLICKKEFFSRIMDAQYCGNTCRNRAWRAKSGEPERKQKLLSQLGEMIPVKVRVTPPPPLTEKPKEGREPRYYDENDQPVY